MPESWAPIREVLETQVALGNLPASALERHRPAAARGTRDALVELRGAADGPTNRSGAETDGQLVSLWLQSHKNMGTRDGYRRDFEDFQELVISLPTVASAALPGRPEALSAVGVRHLEHFMAQLEARGLSARSVSRKLNAVKSLLGFAHRTGYLAFNVGSVVRAPHVVANLAERILSEDQVTACIRAAGKPRNRMLVRFLYLSGIRVGEAVRLRWKDIVERQDRTVVSVVGKGGKLRHIHLPRGIYRELSSFRAAAMSEFVFESRGGRQMHEKDAWRIVHRAAQHAGIKASPHFLRHSHASHAVRRGAPIHVVQQTLGHSNVQTTGMYLHLEQGESSAQYLVDQR